MKISLLLFAILFFPSACQLEYTNWQSYNGSSNRNHYSDLDEVKLENVQKLKLAWIYKSGGADTIKNSSQIQCNPIVIDGILYGVSADRQAFAINAKSGREIWKTNLANETFNMTSRGVSYWKNKLEKRIFFGHGAFLYALDADTGLPISNFGSNGRINLTKGIERPGSDAYAVANTPPTIYQNLVIVGTRVAESATAMLGDIRAFDAITGKLKWTFHTIPKPGEYGYDSWEPDNYQNLGGANNWMGMALDTERGILFAPTGSAAFDFYGGNRKGDNLFANTLLALDAKTGKRIWHFQTVHHDIWDRDIPAPPNLFTIKKDGKSIDVVSVLSKQGYIFVFNRETGEPIYPIKEIPFPASDIEGELTSPTQPVPQLPKPITRQSFTKRDVNSFASNKAEILAEFENMKTGSAFLPLGKEKTIFFPGTDGGPQWGGAAVDKEGIMYIPAKENPVYSSLYEVDHGQKASSGRSLYSDNCASCHGNNKAGNEDGTYPSLIGFEKKYNNAELKALIQKGRGRMPAFTLLKEAEINAIVSYLKGNDAQLKENSANKSDSKFKHSGYNRWYDSEGYPVSTPPWGTLTAVNINTAEQLWQVPLGVYPELIAKGIPPTGTDNYGGPAVTKGELVFIAASKDEIFRAFDKFSGKVVWEYKLPAAAYASPSIYAIDGKQYIVIACGGGKLKSKSGDQYLAFALSN